jgi:hypothetical protein
MNLDYMLPDSLHILDYLPHLKYILVRQSAELSVTWRVRLPGEHATTCLTRLM